MPRVITNVENDDELPSSSTSATKLSSTPPINQSGEAQAKSIIDYKTLYEDLRTEFRTAQRQLDIKDITIKDLNDRIAMLNQKLKEARAAYQPGELELLMAKSKNTIRVYGGKQDFEDVFFYAKNFKKDAAALCPRYPDVLVPHTVIKDVRYDLISEDKSYISAFRCLARCDTLGFKSSDWLLGSEHMMKVYKNQFEAMFNFLIAIRSEITGNFMNNLVIIR
jgi:hypothetical protein